MATVDVNAAAAAPVVANSPSASPRERAQQRLGRLVASLEAVASRIDADNTSQTERTVLRTRFNDLQRQVNSLDGIVSGEGLEARGQDRVSRAPTASTEAPARPQTSQDRVEIAQANTEAAAPSAPSVPVASPTPTPPTGAEGLDMVV